MRFAIIRELLSALSPSEVDHAAGWLHPKVQYHRDPSDSPTQGRKNVRQQDSKVQSRSVID